MKKTPVHAVFNEKWGGPAFRLVALMIAQQVEEFGTVTGLDLAELAADCELSQQEAWRIAFGLHRPGVLEIWNNAKRGAEAVIHRPADWEREARSGAPAAGTRKREEAIC